MSKALPEPAKKAPPTWEDRLPPAQQSVNRFCENWIFAFIVAMAIRHYMVEPFRIPTTSMEPALYGEQALTRSDFVVVDKLAWRFRTVQRYDVTVFQFPHPEVAMGGGIVSARSPKGERLDHWLTRPNVYRSFVKRTVVLPGERFYIAQGDLFVAGPDGTFAVARKPDGVQDILWESIYRHGAQVEPEWYVPWQAVAGAAVENRKESGLTFTVAEGAGITFTQPFRNLYIKPGMVRVQAKASTKGDEMVEVALDQPLFTYHGRVGSVWDLEDWWIHRVTSADLDNRSHGTLLNNSMREFVGDIEVDVTISELSGTVACVLAEGEAQVLKLVFTGDTWTLLRRDEAKQESVLAQGQGVVGRRFRFANLDDEVILHQDDAEVHRSAIAAIDTGLHRLAWSWSGQGRIAVASAAVRRDLHYSQNGFLMPESVPVARYDAQSTSDLGTKAMYAGHEGNVSGSTNPAQRHESGKELFHFRDTRAQILGHEPSPAETIRRYGYSPETAIQMPDDAYLLLGDNSTMSWDSRNWGYVPAANLRGRVVLRIRSRRFGSTYIPFLDWSILR